METKIFDALRVQRYDSRAEMGRAAGEYAALQVRELLKSQPTVNVLFAAAPSQNEMLASFMASKVDFGRVIALHMDEYVGLPADAPQRFAHYLDEHAFHLATFCKVFYLGGEGAPEELCARYAALLKEYPLDLAFLGLGENGHIAFNDPHEADFNDPLEVKQVSLDERSRTQQVHDGCFPTLESVPKQAITLTIPAILRAKRLVCTVPAASKREAVTRTAHDPISEACPGTVLRRHPSCTLFCDRDSGAEL